MSKRDWTKLTGSEFTGDERKSIIQKAREYAAQHGTYALNANEQGIKLEVHLEIPGNTEWFLSSHLGEDINWTKIGTVIAGADDFVIGLGFRQCVRRYDAFSDIAKPGQYI